jgi:hypothetical protein
MRHDCPGNVVRLLEAFEDFAHAFVLHDSGRRGPESVTC